MGDAEEEGVRGDDGVDVGPEVGEEAAEAEFEGFPVGEMDLFGPLEGSFVLCWVEARARCDTGFPSPAGRRICGHFVVMLGVQVLSSPFSRR